LGLVHAEVGGKVLKQLRVLVFPVVYGHFISHYDGNIK
jgi:hypothetical protein